MKRLLLGLALTSCATLHLSPDERRELPGAEDVVPGSPGGDVGATVSDWYARTTLAQPVDPLRPRFRSATISGNLTVGGTLTAPTFASAAAMTVNPGTTWAVHGSNFDVGANGDVTSITKFISNVASGNDAFKVATSGARWHVGTGASDYFSSDGTTVTFAGPLASASGVTAASGTFHASAGSGGLLIKDDTNTQTFTQLVNNLVWDLYNNSTQKLIEANTNGTVGVCAGTPASSSTLATVGGQLSVITADVTSSGASNLISYTMPANVLVTTNRCVRIVGWGTALNNANAKTVALDFGSQTVITKQLNISIASTTWKVQAVVCRSGSNTQDIYAEAWNPMGTTVSSVDGATVLYQAARTAGTQTETATITIKGKTTAATTTDVTMDGLTVEYL